MIEMFKLDLGRNQGGSEYKRSTRFELNGHQCAGRKVEDGYRVC